MEQKDYLVSMNWHSKDGIVCHFSQLVAAESSDDALNNVVAQVKRFERCEFVGHRSVYKYSDGDSRIGRRPGYYLDRLVAGRE